jgi:hypothetical protein
MGNLNFNPNDHEPTTDFELLPAGDYPAVVTASEMKQTKDGTGQYLSLVWQIIDGPAKGRTVFQNLNLVNKNPKAVEIASRDLAGICKAMDLVNLVDNSSELHNKPVMVKLKVSPPRGDYAASNDVKSVKSLAAQSPQQAPPMQAPPQAAPANVYDQAGPPAPPTPATQSPPWG